MPKFNQSIILSTSLISILLSFLTSCFFYEPIRVEYDDVKKIKRLNCINTISPKERGSPIHSVKNEYVKEVDERGLETYHLYVTVNESKSSFGLEDEFYILIDDEDVKKQIDNKQSKDFDSITENRSNILTADSTTVNVVTGYSNNSYLKEQFTITLTEQEINKIKNCTNMAYRYYIGRNQATCILKHTELNKLKKLIDSI